MCPPPPIPSLYNCGNRYCDSWYLDVRKAHDNKSTSFRANITGIWSRPTNGEKKPSWRAAGQKKRAGFSPLDWIRRIPEWRRLEEEGNLRVRAFSQGWWLEREQGRGGGGEDNFLFPASFCPTCEETTRTGDRSGIAHLMKQAMQFIFCKIMWRYLGIQVFQIPETQDNAWAQSQATILAQNSAQQAKVRGISKCMSCGSGQTHSHH